MKSTILSRRDLDFLLYEWLDVEALTSRERFSAHSRETFDAVLELSADIAMKCFAPANKIGDANEPYIGDDGKVVLPEGWLDDPWESDAAAMPGAEEETSEVEGLIVNVAVGYGGRQEIVDAVRALLEEKVTAGATAAEMVDAVTVEAIDANLYTKGQPDPDLVIRTSGEQRLSGFLLWQSAYSEIWFTDAYWPEFRRVDFLRALRDYSARSRRFGK